MRIAFVGKGGSGKTTLAAAFVRYISEKMPVLAIDADVNVHLKNALDCENAIDIGHQYKEIAQYVKGTRTDLGDTSIVATTPPSINSRFITCAENDAFLNKYADKKGNIRLLSIGTYRESDVGHSCYHGKLNTLELIYHHMLDSAEDVVVADATAGIDNLGTSLFFAYDTNIFVVEPTKKSIDVFLEFEKVSQSHKLPTKVVINKAEDGDEEFIARHVPEEKILGIVSRSNAIRLFEQGDPESFKQFINENQSTFENILNYARSNKRDWDAYYQLLLATHQKNSFEWWNDYYQKDIASQFDPEFQYSKVM